RHEAPRVHHAARRRGGTVEAVRCACGPQSCPYSLDFGSRLGCTLFVRGHRADQRRTSVALFGQRLGVSASAPAITRFETAVAKFESVRAAGGPAPTPPTPPNGTINLENILTLIPGEVVPLYIAGSGITVAAADGFPGGWRAIVFWICTLVCVVLRSVASKPVNAQGLFAGVIWRLVAVSLLAFFLWAHAVSEHGPLITSLPAAAWGFFAMVLGVLAPLIVPATK